MKCCERRGPKLPRDLDTIESELRLLAALRRTAAELGAPAPRMGPVDELLDEWLAARQLYVSLWSSTLALGAWVLIASMPFSALAFVS